MTMTSQISQAPVFDLPVLTGNSESVQRLRVQIERIAPHFRMALLIGERGTGKAALAREMYRLSPAQDLPFSSLSVAAFTQDVRGHEASGVLYLHGLERLDIRSQGDLLRRLHGLEREQRIIVSSECDLRGMLAAGTLRKDLLARLGSLEILTTPLRNRMDDLEELAMQMLRNGGRTAWLGARAHDRLQTYAWPQNLEQLAQYLQGVVADDREIVPEDLPVFEVAPALGWDDRKPEAVRLDQVIERHVLDVLLHCAGNKLKTAELLGISRSTLYRMLDSVAVSTEKVFGAD